MRADGVIAGLVLGGTVLMCLAMPAAAEDPVPAPSLPLFLCPPVSVNPNPEDPLHIIQVRPECLLP